MAERWNGPSEEDQAEGKRIAAGKPAAIVEQRTREPTSGRWQASSQPPASRRSSLPSHALRSASQRWFEQQSCELRSSERRSSWPRAWLPSPWRRASQRWFEQPSFERQSPSLRASQRWPSPPAWQRPLLPASRQLLVTTQPSRQPTSRRASRLPWRRSASPLASSRQSSWRPAPPSSSLWAAQCPFSSTAGRARFSGSNESVTPVCGIGLPTVFGFTPK
jgi:hypothetical protein